MHTDELLLDQARRYPALTCMDCIKALYQAEWGCGHLLTDPQSARAYLQREWNATPDDETVPLTEPLGDGFVRVHIAEAKAAGLSPDTLFALFFRASRIVTGNAEHFSAALDRIPALADALPFSQEVAEEALRLYRASGCPATHHSEAFRAAYAPAYRVIDAASAKLLPLLLRIDRLMAKQPRVLVAIDGPAASGKSTLAASLSELYGAPVLPMDDFFLQPHQRTPERFAQPGGNIDHERFAQEVLTPLMRGEAFSYRPFDCRTQAFGEAISVPAAPLFLIEGSYSLHPALEKAYDLRVLTAISPEKQRKRLLLRNGERMLARFLTEWIPLEEDYFIKTEITRRTDIILNDF